MVSIAIVGTEGSGKTVLITTLAKRYTQLNELQPIFMEPLTGKTAQYVEKSWKTLQDYEWPPSTSPGELFDLQWKLKYKSNTEAQLRVVDVAGQDLRILFGQEKVNSLESFPENIRNLVAYVRNADIILLLLNLKDFVGESDIQRRTENEWTLKYVVDILNKNSKNRKFCLVFTQIDLYREYQKQCGNWNEVAKKHLPYVYGAHLVDGRIPIMPISAVSDTEIDISSQRRIPKANFHSEGFSELMECIIENIQTLSKIDQKKESSIFLKESKPTNILQNKPKKKGSSCLSFCFITMILIVFFIFFLNSSNSSSFSSSFSRFIRPVTFTWEIQYGIFNDDIIINNTSDFALRNVKLDVNFVQPNGKKVQKTLYVEYIGKGERHKWINAVSIPHDSKGRATLSCDENR